MHTLGLLSTVSRRLHPPLDFHCGLFSLSSAAPSLRQSPPSSFVCMQRSYIGAHQHALDQANISPMAALVRPIHIPGSFPEHSRRRKGPPTMSSCHHDPRIEFIRSPHPSTSSRGDIHHLPALPVSTHRVVCSHSRDPDTCHSFLHKVTSLQVASYTLSVDRVFPMKGLCQYRSGEDLCPHKSTT